MESVHSAKVMAASVVAAGVGSAASESELQTLLVSLLVLGVREGLYWLRNRKRPRPVK